MKAGYLPCAANRDRCWHAVILYWFAVILRVVFSAAIGLVVRCFQSASCLCRANIQVSKLSLSHQ